MSDAAKRPRLNRSFEVLSSRRLRRQCTASDNPEASDDDSDVSNASSTLGIDIEEGGAKRPLGDLTDVLGTTSANVKRALGCHSHGDAMAVVVKKKIVLTSTFTGALTFEAATMRMLSDVCTYLSLPMESLHVTIYSCCDTHPASRACIKGAKPQFRPLHLFGSVIDRIDKPSRDKLRACLAAKISAWAACKMEYKLGSITKTDRDCEKKKLTMALIAEAIEIMEQCVFLDCGECLMHPGQKCFFSPRMVADFRDAYWIECSGHECQPWSNFGSCSGWLHPATESVLAAVFGVRHYEPRQWLTECSPSFDHGVLAGILGKAVGEISKCESVCPLLASETPGQRCYVLTKEVMSPLSFGVPTSRKRLYCAYDLAPLVVHRSEVSFLDLFNPGVVVADASSYLVSTSEVRLSDRRWRHEKIKDKSVELEMAADMPEEYSMVPGMVARLEAWQVEAYKRGYIDGEGNFRCEQKSLLVNLRQNPAAINFPCPGVCQSLLRGSVLYDLRTRRVVTPEEHWLVQGFPIPCLAVSEEDSQWFPFPSLVRGCPSSTDEPIVETDDEPTVHPLTPDEQRSLTGNSMHWCQIGTWVFYNMLAKTWHT